MENNTPDNPVLPAPLYKAAILNVCTALFCIIVGLSGIFIFKNLSPLLLCICSLFFIYRAFSINKDFKSGKIVEMPVLCTGVKASSFRDRSIVIFRSFNSEGNEDKAYQFNIPSKKTADEFLENNTYMIYFNPQSENVLIAWSNL